MKIKVAIADDHPIVVDGLYNLLHSVPHIDVIATYHTGKALIDGLANQQPDVLLLDLQFPDSTGQSLIAAITPLYPAIRILILSSIDNVYKIKEVMQLGCAGYLLKNVHASELLKAIEKVYAGEKFLQPEIKQQLLDSVLNPGHESIKLTTREKHILELIAQGKTSVEIAEQLSLSYRTIQNNRNTLYDKFKVHNSTELIKVALQLGLVQ